jgi:hypothetical protein
MTIQQAIRKHIKNKNLRVRIGMAIERRGIDLISVEQFNKKYNYDSIMQFPNIGVQTADLLTEVIKKELP